MSVCPSRVLVARPDHLGDLLITLPAIRAVRRSLSDAHIAGLVPPGLCSIAECVTDLDEVIATPFVLGEPPPSPGSPTVEAAATALRGRFDLAIMARPSDPWCGPVVAAAALPLRVGRPLAATVPFLTHAFPEGTSRHVAHEAVLLAFRAVRLLGAGRAPRPPRREPLISLREADRAAAAQLIDELEPRSSSPIVIHPTAGWPLKSWPIEWWARVVQALGRRVRSPLLVAGPAADRRQLDEIVASVRGPAVAVADLGLPALAALYARARAVVGIDSGALHLAALVGTPVIGLFGPFDPHRFGPLAPASRFRALVGRLPCSPCSTLDTPPCRAAREPACLTAIGPDALTDATLALLASLGR